MAKLIGYQVTDPETQHIPGIMSYEVLSPDLLPVILEKLSDNARTKVVILAIYEDTIEDFVMLTSKSIVDVAWSINRYYTQ